MKHLWIAVILVCSAAVGSLQAQDDAETVARELLTLTGAAKIGMQVMDQMISMQKHNLPDVPEEFWTNFMASVDQNELLNLLIPIYTRHFTVAEMKEVISFYKTPVGQKMVGKMPVIAQESIQAGQQWGMKLGMKVAEDLAKKGYATPQGAVKQQ